MNITIQQWLFNNTLLAAIMNDWAPSDSSVSLLININKQNDDSNGTNLSVDYAQYFHTGIYAVNDGQDVYTANITVYNVQLSSAEFVLHEHSNSCQAYLLINDSIDPSDIEMYRTVNSSDLIFGSTSQPNTISFEIINSSVSIAEKPVNIDIDIQYQLVNNFYNMTISRNLLVDKIIDKPNITVVGTSDNCTIEIHNQNNTDITCFRHIKYCFLINGTLLQCFISNISNSLELNYTWNWTSVDLSIEYDIIFARYIFEFNILKCADDEFNTNNFSSPQDTVTDSYNSTTNYSDGADLLTSTHMFPTQLNATNTDQDTTFSTITDADIIKPTATIPATTNPATTDVVSTYLTTTNTTTGILNITDPITSHSTIIDANTTEPIITNLSTIISTENTPMSSSTTTNLTSPPECPEALAKWKIALIAVGPVIGVSLIVGVLGFFIWKRKHSETPKMNFPMHDWLPPQETHVEKPISQPKLYGHNRSVPSETFLSEPDERRHGKRHHHRPKTSEHDEQLQPISLPPLPRSRTRLERMERRRNRRRSRPTNHEETIAMSVNPIHQHQVPRNRPKRLPPLHHD